MLLQITCFSESSNFCSSCLLGIIDLNRSFENRTTVRDGSTLIRFRIVQGECFNQRLGICSIINCTIFSCRRSVSDSVLSESDLKWLSILHSMGTRSSCRILLLSKTMIRGDILNNNGFLYAYYAILNRCGNVVAQIPQNWRKNRNDDPFSCMGMKCPQSVFIYYN